MAAGEIAAWAASVATRELGLFAAAGLLVGGLDDLLIDLVWLVRAVWRELTVYRVHPRATLETLPPPDRSGRIAIFMGAWREADVIGTTIATALQRFGQEADYRIYIGTYPNDPETEAALHQSLTTNPEGATKVVIVRGAFPGPTSKAEALNRCWDAMLEDERASGPVKAIALHDAEDFVHPGELKLFDWMIERFELVQIPVRPINAGDLLGISGHYLDEFAEAHCKQLVIREALGASIPSAGTGCAIARAMLGRIAAARGGHPFASDSLTEDYELGLRLRDHGGRGAFIRLPASRRGEIVAVQAYFPNQGSVAVRQKARWIEGIALAGWERLGWRGGPIETWMRLRDRRSPLAALVLLAAYLYLLVAGSNQALAFTTGAPLLSGIAIPPWLARVNFALLIWRVAMRMMLVRHLYGWREGFWAGPRIIVSSFITIGAAGRAVRRHLFPAPSLTWDKTPHRVHPVTRPGASFL